MRKTDFDIVVVGGGIVGLAAAYRIGLRHRHLRIGILEKEESLASHQTGRNSGVIHSGLYYRPGSAKARTCTEGRKLLVAFAKRHKIPHEICGKVIIATDKKQLPRLDQLLENGQANGIAGLRKLDAAQAKQIEPATEPIAGLFVPCTGIIDFVAVTNKLAELIGKRSEGNKILTDHEVLGFQKHDFYTEVGTNQGSFTAGYVINCGGLQCDRIARMDGLDPAVRIVPFRGDYYELTEEAAAKVKSLIYPVPDPAFPFLGVHVTRMGDGSVECGPNAVFAFKREGYDKKAFDFRDTLESLAYRGTRRLFLKHWRYGLGEYARSLSKGLFLKSLRRLIPSLGPDDIQPSRCGVRAQAVGRKGDIVDDFLIERNRTAIHVLNAPSPAATAALAIGEHINDVATKHFNLG